MTYRRGSGRALILVLLGGGLGCSDPSPPPADPCTDDQEVTIEASGGLQPVFTWTPACHMTSLMVFPEAGLPASWVLYGGDNAESNPLRSGIRYGQPPFGTLEAAPEALLQEGVDYRVLIFRWLGEPGEGGGPFERGAVTFRP